MSVKLENIDELRRRANVSYEDAKEALEKCNDDILEALIYLEKQKKVNCEQASAPKTSFGDKLKGIVRKGNNTKLIIKKKENILLSIPVTAAVIIAALAFHVVFIGLLVLLIAGYRIKFEGKNSECTKVNETLSKVSDTIDSAKRKLAEDANGTSAD